MYLKITVKKHKSVVTIVIEFYMPFSSQNNVYENNVERPDFFGQEKILVDLYWCHI